MLRSDATAGLSTAEATRRRQFHGYNEFDVSEHEPIWKKYLEQVCCLCSLKKYFISV